MNWDGQCRSNIVLLKDVDALKKWEEAFAQTSMTLHTITEHPLGVWFEGSDDNGSFDATIYGAEVDEDEAIDINELAKLMTPGQVLVVMEAGSEGLRYVSGWAEAYNTDGGEIRISLSDIYQRAWDEWGIRPTIAEFHTLPNTSA